MAKQKGENKKSFKLGDNEFEMNGKGEILINGNPSINHVMGGQKIIMDKVGKWWNLEEIKQKFEPNA